MVVSEIRLYELLKARIGEKVAEAFVEIPNKRVGQKFEDSKATLATKEDLLKLREELNQNKQETLKTIYLVSLGQLWAIIGCVVAIVNLLK